MKLKNQTCFRLSAIVGFFALLVIPGVATFAQPEAEPQGFPQDWSHRHLIFSQPESFEQITSEPELSSKTSSRPGSRGQAVSSDRMFDRLDRYYAIMDEPRYLIQLQQREREAAALAQEAGLSGTEAVEWIAQEAADARAWDQMVSGTQADNSGGTSRAQKKKPSNPPPVVGNEIPRDWQHVMGGAGGRGISRTFPAKYSFSTSTKSCANDFIVYTTGTAGNSSSGTTYSTTGTFTGVPAATQTVTITNTLYPTVNQVLELTAHGTSNDGFNFAVGANLNEAAANLAAAIVRNGGRAGVTASSAAGVVTLTSLTTSTIMTTGSINPAETLNSFTWGAETAGTGAGTAGQPTIFALNNLYKADCNIETPTVMWSYNTGTGAVADLSPVLSFYDGGKQVAFVQKAGGNQAQLVLLKWRSGSPGTVGAPTTPNTAGTAADYRNNTGTCADTTVACMYVMNFSGNPNNTSSSPFVDYATDALYVGDNTGKVHKFTGVFRGTPAQASGSGWPAQAGATTSIMSSPVYWNGNVYIGSSGPNATTGNKLHRVPVSLIDGSGSTPVNSGTIGNNDTDENGVRDTPIVNASLSRVYAFQGAYTTVVGTELDSVSGSCNAGGTGQICNAIFNFSTSFASGNQGDQRVYVGRSGNQDNLDRGLNSGAFDDAYYSFDGDGALYVCGSLPLVDREATLWKVVMNNGNFDSKTLGPKLVSDDSNDSGCAPPTVFLNGSNEYLFVGVVSKTTVPTALGGGACTVAGCAYSYALPTAASFSTTSTSAALNSTLYLSVSSTAAPNATESAVETTMTAAQAGSYYAMTITQGAVNGNATSRTYTLRKNGADTGLACTIPLSQSSCTIVTGSATFAGGDKIAVQMTRSGTQNLTQTVRVVLGWNSELRATAALDALGGTGGIIVDNSLGGGGSQIYYSTRATTRGVAYQASQAALQ